jgi:hypothetical protein
MFLFACSGRIDGLSGSSEDLVYRDIESVWQSTIDTIHCLAISKI